MGTIKVKGHNQIIVNLQKAFEIEITSSNPIVKQSLLKA